MIGVLALQGDVREHRAALDDLGVGSRPVRWPADLDGLDGIVLPGGESTTLSLLLESSGLFEPLDGALRGGLPALGTCAGLVLLARELRDGRADQRTFAALDCVARRNGYGRQAQSFEGMVEASKVSAELGVPDAPLPAVFIRAPVIESVGPGVEVLGTVSAGADREPQPVVVRQGHVLATAFHPELTADRRIHRLFVAMTGAPVR